ncbi:DUF1829 domain-containing protein [Clostridium sp. JNZ J1-5]
MKKLIESYYNWLKENTIINTIGEYTEVTTPFLDRHNDCIQFYIKKLPNNEIFLTDDGYVLNDLEDSGFTFNTLKRKNILNDILKVYHIDKKDDCLTIVTSEKDFPQRKHFYIQGILAINDLYNINKNNVASLFAEDVAKFLEENDILYNDNVKITGKSGYDHNIDYILPPNRKKNTPEKYIKVINNPSKNNTESTLFTWNDIKNYRKSPNLMFVILNDEDNKIKSDILSAYNSYDVKPLFWTKKNDIVKELTA